MSIPPHRLLDLPLPNETQAHQTAAPSLRVAGGHEELMTLACAKHRTGCTSAFGG